MNHSVEILIISIERIIFSRSYIESFSYIGSMLLQNEDDYDGRKPLNLKQCLYSVNTCRNGKIRKETWNHIKYYHQYNNNNTIK